MKVIWIAVVCLLSGVVVSNGFAMSSMVEKSELAGKAAPEFNLPMLKGGQASLTQLRDGKPSIIFFWATWCPHCHEELNRLKVTLPEIEAKGIKMILIDSGEEADKVRKFVERNGISSDVVLDLNSSLDGAYQIIGIPTFYFIDGSGIIRNVTHELPKDFEKLFK